MMILEQLKQENASGNAGETPTHHYYYKYYQDYANYYLN